MGEPTINGTGPQSRPGYSRVLLKLGGEMFGGGAVGLDPGVRRSVAAMATTNPTATSRRAVTQGTIT